MNEPHCTGNQATAGPQPTFADIYGQAYLWVEQSGGRPGLTTLIYQVEDGTSYSEDAAVYFGGPESWFPPDVLACEQVSGRVLDIGCGAGRHALAISRSGHQVVGLEPSVDAVAVARRRGVDARFGSLLDPPDDLGTFDTFLLLGANLALLTTYPNPATTLARLAGMANPGAQILGSDIRMDAIPEASRLRVRVQHDAELSEWSTWEGGQPYVPPERLGDVVAATGWILEEIQYSPDPTGDGYLARLRLTDSSTSNVHVNAWGNP